ncbi:MAG: MBL fold metallo-hydrolase [Vicinamibacterales bacterium]
MQLNRRQFFTTSSAALAGLAAARVPAWAQAAQAPPATRFEELRRGVGIFTGNGGTIGYLVNGDGAVAVDSQFMDTAKVCVEGLQGRTPRGLAMLINTHHHGDHTAGNPAFRPAVKRILAHANCAAWHRKVAEQAGNAAEQAFPDATFTDTWSEPFGDETIHLRYMGPGHTSGDAIVFFEKANVVHGGDLLFRRVHPFIDRPAGAEIANWVRVLDEMAKGHGGDTIFVFGHGKDGVVRGTVSDVTYFRDYLAAVLEHATTGVQAGKSKEEVTAVTVLPGFDAVGQVSPRLSLASVLGVAYDEASARK